MFAQDRDLLLLEPNLFAEVGWLGQRLLNTTGSVNAGTLTIDGVNFVDAGVAIGHIALIGGTPTEVVGFLSAAEAILSRPRVHPAAPIIAPPDASDASVVINTFAPQLVLAHQRILTDLGLRPAGEGTPDQPDESAITSPRDLWLLEALWALEAIYLAAESPVRATPAAQSRRSDLYTRRAQSERTKAVARLDLNGDGCPDHLLTPHTRRLHRG